MKSLTRGRSFRCGARRTRLPCRHAQALRAPHQQHCKLKKFWSFFQPSTIARSSWFRLGGLCLLLSSMFDCEGWKGLELGGNGSSLGKFNITILPKYTYGLSRKKHKKLHSHSLKPGFLKSHAPFKAKWIEAKREKAVTQCRYLSSSSFPHLHPQHSCACSGRAVHHLS